MEFTIPPCDRHDLRFIRRRQVQTVQLQQEGLTLREIASRLKVLVDVVHKMMTTISRRSLPAITGLHLENTHLIGYGSKRELG